MGVSVSLSGCVWSVGGCVCRCASGHVMRL